VPSEGRLPLASLALAVLAALAVAVPATAHPPTEPDHGVNETAFPILWSGDVDGNVSEGGEGDNETEAVRQLANGSDVPLNTPPADVETWNAGEIDEFPSTNRSVSIRPAGANARSGRFVKDAYASIFAIQPSTRARISTGGHSLYVDREGTVLGTVDYRVELPEDDTNGSREVYWSLEDHTFEGTRLLVDGREVASGGGTHTPQFSFEDLDEGPHSLTLAANVSVRVEEHVRTEERVCEQEGNETTCHTEVNHQYTDHNESVTVTDAVDVVVRDLEVSGRRASYPNGDTAIALTANRPWLGHSLPHGNVTGTWRLYSARDQDWDALVYSTANGSARRHSPMHPLQVNAFPFEMGASASQGNATVLATDGRSYSAPSLPENVNLDTRNGSYSGTETIVTRVPGDVSTVRARGFVRGVGTTVDAEDLEEVEVHRSNLTLSVVNESANTTTVHVSLRDETTGAPIDTSGRDGYVVLAGERVNTSGDGTVTRTLRQPGAIISARYEPGHWWNDAPGYVGDSETISVGGPSLQLLATLFRFAIPVGLFGLAVYMVDRVTQWRIWPPWRGL